MRTTRATKVRPTAKVRTSTAAKVRTTTTAVEEMGIANRLLRVDAVIKTALGRMEVFGSPLLAARHALAELEREGLVTITDRETGKRVSGDVFEQSLVGEQVKVRMLVPVVGRPGEQKELGLDVMRRFVARAVAAGEVE